MLVSATLRSEDYQLLEASDGEETLALARSEHPDLILLDISMPQVDGFEVCRRLKSEPDTNGIRVVMLTARSQEAERLRGEEVRADGYFTKPFSPLALLHRISEVLGEA